jgi:TonB family protein
MNNLLLYILKVSAGTTILYICYLLLFSKDTFYLRNRILLILILFLPLFFPALKIPVSVNSPSPTAPVTLPDSYFLAEPALGTTISAPVNSFNYNRLIILIYFIIAGVLLLRIVISLISTYRIIKGARIKSSQFPKVVITDNQIPPFSFFPYAVIPVEEYNNGNYSDLLDHEFAHIKQGHTFDLLLSELFIASQWFNPVIWLIRRSIVLNHEYLADKVTLINMKSVKEYQYRLLNFQSGFKNITLAHSFNSLIKNRIIMINKKPTWKYAMLKTFLILPVTAFLIYAFATPEYKYDALSSDVPVFLQSVETIQQGVKGIVINKEGKALEKVNVSSTGTVGNAMSTSTDKEGKFSILNAQADAYLSFYLNGYKRQTIKADFASEMVIKMERNPNNHGINIPALSPDVLIVINGVISEKPQAEALNEINPEQVLSVSVISEIEARNKYGDKGKNGVLEITAREKFAENGILVPYIRQSPDDYPTFQGKPYVSFKDWLLSKVNYPAEAAAMGRSGHITANYTVNADGTIGKVAISGMPDRLLADAVINAIKSSPKWEPAKNQKAREPFSATVSLFFELPDKIIDDEVYVKAEIMPKYTGGDAALLNFINRNTKYPEAAMAEEIEGQVIVRFIVNKDGDAEDPVILKGVHPLLDAEALRVIGRLKEFDPGYQGGNPVKVYYMAPVKFSLSEPKALFSRTSELEILKFLASNTGYPSDSKIASDTGKIYVVVKMDKGGVLRECNAFLENTGITAPFLPEMVIVGYKPAQGYRTSNPKGNDHVLLKEECIRVANKIGTVDIPEWREKDLEFVLTWKFILTSPLDISPSVTGKSGNMELRKMQ